MTLHSISRAFSIDFSTMTFRSYSTARRIASISSFLSCALLIPMLEPVFDGLTKQGY